MLGRKKHPHGHDIGGAKIEPPSSADKQGDSLPGFGGEGERSELADGAPLDEQTRRSCAEHNHGVTQDTIATLRYEQSVELRRRH